jgi:hypothetical protein
MLGYKGSIERLLARLETVSDWRLFTFAVLWVVVGGLLLQLIVLPYLVSFAHAGHGLIANLDALGYHNTSVEQAERIRQQGWDAWWLVKDGLQDYVVALSSVLYLLYPEPWVILPINGLLFGIVAVVIRRLLAISCDSSAAALVGLTPFFLFPSFISIWGQPSRDLNTGVGFSLVLYALVLAGARGGGSAGVFRFASLAAVGMGVTWLSRPYALSLIAAASVVFVALACLGNRCQRVRLSAVATVVVLAAVWSSEVIKARVSDAPAAALAIGAPSADQFETPDVTQPSPSFVWTAIRLPHTRKVLPRVRGGEGSLRSYENCLPYPTNAVSSVLFRLCRVREGYIHSATDVQASSGVDYDIRLRSAEDFIAYAPRAVAVAVLEPGPGRWGTEQTTVGKLASVFIPFEMVLAYVSFLLALILAGRRVVRPETLAVVAFCTTYIVFYVLATPQLGTLYRMRAFPFAIVVGVALTVALARRRIAN